MIILLTITLVLVSFTATLGATINAASASRTDVTTAITSASAGDTVQVPAGSATWASAISITKNISVIGAGTNAGGTIITCSGDGVDIGGTALGVARFSAFKLTGSGTARGVTIAAAPTNHIRVDHCWLEGFYYCIEAFGCGVADHNTMKNWGLAVCNTEAPSTGANPSDAQMQYARNNWASPTDLASTNAMYFEDNLFAHTSYNNANNLLFTANWCGGYIVRRCTGQFNFVGTFQQMFDFHGNQGNINSAGTMRGTYALGAYQNMFTCTGASMSGQFAHIRSGAGLIFSNVLSGTVTSAGIDFQEEDADGTWGYTGPPYYDQITNVWVWANTAGAGTITASALNSETAAIVGNGVYISNAAPSQVVTLSYPHPLILAQDGGGSGTTIQNKHQNGTGWRR